MKMVDEWVITDHVCQICFGRVLRRVRRMPEIHRCADCGYQAEGPVQSVCMCGSKLKNSQPAPFRCVRNPAPSWDNGKAEIVVAVGSQTG